MTSFPPDSLGMRTLVAIVALATCAVAPVGSAQSVAPMAVGPLVPVGTMGSALAAPRRASYASAGRPMPAWLKWGLVGAGAGAVTFSLLGSMASDSRSEPAKDAVAGAAVGFVIVGGGVALWQAVCGPDSSSRRAGLCPSESRRRRDQPLERRLTSQPVKPGQPSQEGSAEG